MNYLDLTAEQASDLAAGKVVEVWERMEPQPEHRRGRIYRYKETTGNMLAIAKYHAPHPPGTRARVREPVGGARGMMSSQMVEFATSTTTRPEQRDGVWGFVTGWVQA